MLKTDSISLIVSHFVKSAKEKKKSVKNQRIYTPRNIKEKRVQKTHFSLKINKNLVFEILKLVLLLCKTLHISSSFLDVIFYSWNMPFFFQAENLSSPIRISLSALIVPTHIHGHKNTYILLVPYLCGRGIHKSWSSWMGRWCGFHLSSNTCRKEILESIVRLHIHRCCRTWGPASPSC